MTQIDTESWLPVLGYEGFYSVSTLGRVRSERRYVEGPSGPKLIRTRFLVATPTIHGYPAVVLARNGGRKTFTVHKLVLTAFRGAPEPGMEACHKNGIKSDASLENLRWDTRKANHADKHLHGTMPRGSSHRFAKLSEAQVREIRRDPRIGREIARDYGVTANTITRIKSGERWGYLE